MLRQEMWEAYFCLKYKQVLPGKQIAPQKEFVSPSEIPLSPLLSVCLK
jgi:hypothetical protein